MFFANTFKTVPIMVKNAVSQSVRGYDIKRNRTLHWCHSAADREGFIWENSKSFRGIM